MRKVGSIAACKGGELCLKEPYLLGSLICDTTELQLGRLSTTMAKLDFSRAVIWLSAYIFTSKVTGAET